MFTSRRIIFPAKFDFILQCVYVHYIKLTLDGFSVVFHKRELSLKKNYLLETTVRAEIHFNCDFQNSLEIYDLYDKIYDHTEPAKI